MQDDYCEPDYNNGSPTDHPFGYLEYFLLKGEFRKFHTNFFTEKYIHGTNWSSYYRPKGKLTIEEEHMLYEDDLVNKLHQALLKIFFKDEFEGKLKNEIEEIKRYIKAKIETFDFENVKITTYLVFVINELVNIVNKVKCDVVYQRYPSILKQLYQLTSFILSQYGTFLSPSKFHIFKESEEYSKAIQSESTLIIQEEKVSIYSSKKACVKKENKEIVGFKWKANQKTNTSILYFFLLGKEIIHKETTPDSFAAAFKGERIEKPLKIRWILRTKKGDIKPVIWRIINLLMFELKLLEVIKVQLHLAKTIEAIFADQDGNLIKNTAVTISGMKKNKGIILDLEIEAILKELRLVQFSVKT